MSRLKQAAQDALPIMVRNVSAFDVEAVQACAELRAALAAEQEQPTREELVRKQLAEARELLTAFVNEYPPFKSRPLGAPNSSARIEQENRIQLDDQARALLAKHDGGKS